MSAPERQHTTLVAKQFEEQIGFYTSEARSARDSRIVSYLAEALAADPALRAGGALRVCEFGGADGILLRSVRERLGTQVELTNAELVEAYAPRQASPSIRFVRTSLLQPDFADASFDVVVARHVLHHLIGDTLAATRENQARAFAELARVTRPGGLVLIEEHLNPSDFACRLFYYASRAATRLKMRLPWFEVTPYTVVAFLTPREFRRVAGQATRGQLRTLVEEFHPAPMPLQWRLTLLRRNSRNLFIALRRA